MRRGLVDANLFVEHGCNCSISTNNILNPFTPFGDCSLIRMANLHANVLQMSQRERIAECFAMLTTRSAQLMNLTDYGIAVGQSGRRRGRSMRRARSRRSPRSRQPLAVFKNGKRTVTRHRAELHRPS